MLSIHNALQCRMYLAWPSMHHMPPTRSKCLAEVAYVWNFSACGRPGLEGATPVISSCFLKGVGRKDYEAGARENAPVLINEKGEICRTVIMFQFFKQAPPLHKMSAIYKTTPHWNRMEWSYLVLGIPLRKIMSSTNSSKDAQILPGPGGPEAITSI